MENIKGVYLEIEKIGLGKDEDDENTRIRRRGFYLKNGFEKSDIESNLYGIDYEIYIKIFDDKSLKDSKFETECEICFEYNNIYIKRLSEKSLKKYVSIKLKQGEK